MDTTWKAAFVKYESMYRDREWHVQSTAHIVFCVLTAFEDVFNDTLNYLDDETVEKNWN